ncbi:hypothetical protein AAF712_010538 [Marasmius tenuissimus]|uniref:Uncharacterized protein n=1 Tax=Marasmius tenuissimus TaxID=585030 RepID=A0ABR2ZNU9_9AGAR
MGQKKLPTDVSPQILVLPDGSEHTTEWDSTKKKHIVICDRCKETITLTRTADPYNLEKHWDSDTCGRNAERNSRWQHKQGFPQSLSESRQFTTFEWTLPTIPEQSTPTELPPSSSRNLSLSASSSTSSLSSSSLIGSLEGIGLATPSRQPTQTMSYPLYNQSPVPSNSRFSITTTPAKLATPDISLYPDCPGERVRWIPGCSFATYPYHRHEKEDLPWYPLESVHDPADGTWYIILRSRDCSMQSSSIESPRACRACWGIPHSQAFKRLVLHSMEEPKEHKPYTYLNARQMRVALSAKSKEVKKKNKTIRILRRRRIRLRAKINDEKRIRMYLSTHDVPGLRRILVSSLNSSPERVLDLLQRAVTGEFSARGNFTRQDIDMAFLVKAFGGSKLLYVFQKLTGFASPSTVRRHLSGPELAATTGEINSQYLDNNISSALSPNVKPPPPNAQLGNILMADNVAVEERCQWAETSNEVKGISRESATRTAIGLRVDDYDSVVKIANAMNPELPREKRVVIGTEATVCAVAPYARDDHYTAIPIVVSASDKTETGEEIAVWVQRVIDRYRDHPDGERVHGPLWSFGTDGDGTYRKGKHILFMAEEVPASTELGKHLRKLVGLNIYTSKEGIVGTCDPKHVIKRFATFLRNVAGMTVVNRRITPQIILNQLTTLGLQAEEARLLLDPADKQNVPKATKLIQRLHDLVNTSSPSLNPHDANDRKYVSFIAEVLYFFVEPFVNPEMSLSQQVRSLVAYAHLIAALYIRHQTAFMTGALYADSQAIVKNIIFLVARTQLVDSNARLFIILEGTDRLEMVFGDCRTLDHSRNFDVLQLAEKLSTSTMVNIIFEKYPHLNRGHRRLSVKGVMGVDHVNPKSWIGDTAVGAVDLEYEWKEGRALATGVLEKYFAASDVSMIIDFDEAFKAGSGMDLLRPLGKIVGVSLTTDDNRSEVETPAILDTGVPTATNRADAVGGHPNLAAFFMNDSTADIDSDTDSESGSSTDSDTEVDGVGGSSPGPMATSTSGHIDHDSCTHSPTFSDESEIPSTLDHVGTIDLETLSDDASPIQADIPVSRTVIGPNGRIYLKSSVVAMLLQHFRSRKVTLRPLRVQRVALEDLGTRLRFANESPDLSGDGDNVMRTNDIAACLVRTKSGVALAVIVILGFRVGSTKELQHSVGLDDLEDPNKSIKVTCQILEMNQLQRDDSYHWQWNGNYVNILSTHKATVAQRHYIFEVPGTFVLPLGPNVVWREVITPTGVAGRELTWRVEETELRDALEDGWALLNPEDPDELLGYIFLLPYIDWDDVNLPYINNAGSESLVVCDLPKSLLNVTKDPKKPHEVESISYVRREARMMRESNKRLALSPVDSAERMAA